MSPARRRSSSRSPRAARANVTRRSRSGCTNDRRWPSTGSSIRNVTRSASTPVANAGSDARASCRPRPETSSRRHCCRGSRFRWRGSSLSRLRDQRDARAADSAVHSRGLVHRAVTMHTSRESTWGKTKGGAKWGWMRSTPFCLSVLVALSVSSVSVPGGAQGTFKVAYYNIQSGMGMTQLRGACAFERHSNCTDASQPMNAWGKGVVQAELHRAVNGDASIIALGLSEAWACANPDAVLKAIGWKAHAGERNGTTLLARHGFAGPAEWVQLDTSLNSNPKDTMWVVRAPVCADAACTRTIQVFASHWYAKIGRASCRERGEIA